MSFHAAVFFVFALMLVAGCTPGTAAEAPTQTGLVVESPLAPTLADPTGTPSSMLTYVSESGRFSIQYPPDYTLYADQRPGVDGVISPLPEDTIAILSPASPNFLLTIEYIPLPGGTSLVDLASQASQTHCDLNNTARQEFLIAHQNAFLFPDLPCGPYGYTLLLTLFERDGYVMTVESHQSYADVSDAVMQIISTFQHLNTSP
jgi:hypothetical protein